MYYNKLVIRIQKYARGMVVRKWVAEWYLTRRKIVTTWQAHTRKYLSNLHSRAQMSIEKQMAIKIQKTFRGMAGRRKFILKLKTLMATRIQAMWRGVVGRSKADILWLNRAAIPMQKIARKYLAYKGYRGIKDEKNAAALIIQKKFRSWKARCRLGDALVKREMDYRMLYVRMLTSEEEICQEKIAKLAARLNKNNLKLKAETAMRKLLTLREKIRRKENDLIEIRRQLDLITPRSKQQGWAAELGKNSTQIRDQLTEMKMQYLFNLSEDVSRHEDNLERQVREIEIFSIARDKVADWKEQEYEERRHLSYKGDISKRRRERRQEVADERRRWQVLYFSRDGKPDKKRRPGRPWDPSVFAGPEKGVYSVGRDGVDLLALNERPGDDKLKPGSLSSAARTMDKVSLQAYLEQVNCYEQLLKPIADIMQKSLSGNGNGNIPSSRRAKAASISSSLSTGPAGRAASGSASSSASAGAAKSTGERRSLVAAMGPTGKELTSALEDIGALPPRTGGSSAPSSASSTKLTPLLPPSSSGSGGGSAGGPSRKRQQSSRKSSILSKSLLSRILLQPLSTVSEYDSGSLEASGDAQDNNTNSNQRRNRKKANRRSAVIPWDLLDSLDGEKKRFEKEKLFVEFHKKF